MSKTEYFVFHREWYELKKELSTKAWAELEDYMLKLRFDGIDTDPKSIKNKTVRLQWIMIRKKIYDSINNMERQKKHRNKNVTDNNTSDEVNTPQPEISLQIEPNDEFKVDIPTEEKNKKEENNISNTEEDMGNLTNIVIVDGKAMIKEPAIETRSYSKAQIEDIKQKLIDKNIPKQEPVTITLEKPEISFQDFVNEHKYQINDIIKDFADGTRLRRTQGQERLKSILSSKAGRYYEKQILALIENNVLKLTA